MKNAKIVMGALALAVVAATIIACNKEKTTQQESQASQKVTSPNDLTLAEMKEALGLEEGKAFFENQPIKDYTYVCEKLLNDCEFSEKTTGLPYEIVWGWRVSGGNCNPEASGTCIIIRKKENESSQANVMGYFEDGKLVIVPLTEENGFTADGFLPVGMSIEVQYDSIEVQEGIYAAYYDEDAGRYTAVAVDYHCVK